MKKRRRWRNEVSLRNSSPPGDYGKGPGHQGEREHARVPGGEAGNQDRNQGSGAIDFQGEGGFGAHRQLSGKRAAPRPFRGLPSRLEEGVRAVEGRRKDAGVRAKSLKAAIRESLKAEGDELRAVMAIKT